MKTRNAEVEETKGRFQDLFIDYQCGDDMIYVRALETLQITPWVQVSMIMSARELACAKWINAYARKRLHVKAKVTKNLAPDSQGRDHYTPRHDIRIITGRRKDLAEKVKAVIKNKEDMLALATLFAGSPNDALDEKIPALGVLRDQYWSMESGTWKKVPWSSQGWVDENPLRWAHRVHVSEKDPMLVAYNQSVDKINRNIQTQMKPGKYLRQFYPKMTDEEVRAWSHKFEAQNKPHEFELISNTDPKGWVEAYSHEVQASSSSCTSCMTGQDCVRVYAHPGNDLALLVIRQDDGVVIARAIVNTKKKAYVRAYTNKERLSSSTFEGMLDAAGWGEDRACLRGQALQRIEHDNNFVCPYIDGDYQYVTDNDDHLYISSDGVGASNTNGYSNNLEDCRSCDVCGDSMSDDESTYIACEGNDVCQECLDEHYVYAYGRPGRNGRPSNQAYARERDCTEVGGEWYLDAFLSDNDIHECDHSGDHYHLDDLVTLACGAQVATENFRRANVVLLDVESEDAGSMHAYEHDTVTLSDGRVVYEADAEDLQAEIDAEAEGEDDGVKSMPAVIIPSTYAESINAMLHDLPFESEPAGPVPQVQQVGWPFPIGTVSPSSTECTMA